MCALGGLVVTTIEGTGAVRRQNPEFPLHGVTASRYAAPLAALDSPVHVVAAQQAQEKRAAVLEDVSAARATNATPSVKIVTDVAQHPSEHSHDGMNPVAHRLALNNGSQCGYCSVGFAARPLRLRGSTPIHRRGSPRHGATSPTILPLWPFQR